MQISDFWNECLPVEKVLLAKLCKQIKKSNFEPCNKVVSTILEKNTIKTLEVIFHIPLAHARGHSWS